MEKTFSRNASASITYIMASPIAERPANQRDIHTVYMWAIASIAALGGFLLDMTGSSLAEQSLFMRHTFICSLIAWLDGPTAALF